MASGTAAAPAVQTVVLRVSIHCHGCKKKVRKVLRSIEGVQNVTVDASQHKVTVTGTVDANTLVQRLHKSGKKGVPWNCHEPANKTEAAAPAPAPAPAEKKSAGDGGKDAAAAAPAAAADKKPEEAAVKEPKAESSEKKQPEPEKKAEEKVEAKKKAEEKVEAKKAEEKVEAKKDAEPKAKGAEPPAKEKVEAKKTEEKVEAKKEAEPKAKVAEPPAKEEAKAEAAPAKDKDEAKKNDKPKDAGKPEPISVTTSERSLSMPAPAAPPKHAYYEEDYGYRHPYNNYAAAPQPVMSYHAAQPSASVSYYAPQPQPAYSMQQPEYSSYQQAQQQQGMRQWSPSYLYLPYPHATPEPYHHDYYSPPGMHAPPPMPMQDSYRIFDDENPNSCSVM